MSDHGVKTGPTMASPFYPQKRTLSGCLGMSEKCQKRTWVSFRRRSYSSCTLTRGLACSQSNSLSEQ